MRQKVLATIAVILAAAMVVSMVASLAYGLRLRAVASPYPDPATNRIASVIAMQRMVLPARRLCLLSA